MSDAPLTCPYCDAFVDAPAAGRHGRMVCPRCGESFNPATEIKAGQPAFAATSESIDGDMPLSSRQKPRARNRVVGLGILGLMVVLFATAMTYALITSSLRRAHDSGRSQSEKQLPIPADATTLPETGPVAPAKLAALGYLPPDTSLIVGVHMAEIGDTLKNRDDLLDTPIQFGPVRGSIETLVFWSGFKPKEVQHLVLGVKIEDPLVPRVEFIIHTKVPHDPDAVRKKLDAKRLPDDGDRRIDTFKLGDKNVSIVLWCADDQQTFVFGLVPSDVKACPLQPRRDLEQLPHEIREILQDRVGGVGPLWIAGTADDWSKTQAQLFFQQTKPEGRERLKRVHAFAAWVQLDQNVTVNGAFDCSDEAGAKGLATYLRGLEKADNPDVETVIDGKWLTLQWRTSLETIVKSLGAGNP